MLVVSKVEREANFGHTLRFWNTILQEHIIPRHDALGFNITAEATLGFPDERSSVIIKLQTMAPTCSNLNSNKCSCCNALLKQLVNQSDEQSGTSEKWRKCFPSIKSNKKERDYSVVLKFLKVRSWISIKFRLDLPFRLPQTGHTIFNKAQKIRKRVYDW